MEIQLTALIIKHSPSELLTKIHGFLLKVRYMIYIKSGDPQCVGYVHFTQFSAVSFESANPFVF